MYQPEHFRLNDPAPMHQLMREHPLATLVAQSAEGMVANHVPMLLVPEQGEHGVLQCHVARANPLWREVDVAQEVLAIFNGPQAYISPGWYPTKREHGKVVPTWNYAVVHAWGRLRVVDDAAWLRSLVSRLTATHEAGFEKPWSIDDAPADYIDKMLSAIVGIEITITRLEGKAKVSQNQPAANREGVVQGLAAKSAAPGDQASAMVNWINTSGPR
ncbi:MAG: hypothetical protein RLZZ271_1153 [Pseudomonadota bacterium]|jgi:transcriptional regulator